MAIFPGDHSSYDNNIINSLEGIDKMISNEMTWYIDNATITELKALLKFNQYNKAICKEIRKQITKLNKYTRG